MPVDAGPPIVSPRFVWEKLLRTIRYEQVIPIIGPELLPYHQTLAPALASALGVDGDRAARGISAVADAAGGGTAATEELSLLLQSYGGAPSGPLAELATIDEFRLIFTTDYISLVENAFRDAGKPCQTLGFALRRQSDAIVSYPDDGQRAVYHLLGHLEKFGAIALPRARQLEYLYNLTTGHNDLLGVLRESRNLLFLGCNFPEWISGLFTRMLLGKPIYDSRETLEVVACSGHDRRHDTSSFTAFLRDHRVEIYPGDAASFVTELVARYRAASASPRPTQPPSKGHTFISYCRADLAAAQKLASELAERGVTVWFDERDVAPGTPVDDAIRLAIEDDSAAFIAVVSKRVFQTQRSYFLREWKCALDTQDSYAPGVPFAFPVVVDDQCTSEAVAGLRAFFPAWAELNVECCPGGRASNELIAALKEARKRFERRRMQ